MSVGYEYIDGILVCAQHHTPVQKGNQGFWCRKCENAKLDDEAWDTLAKLEDILGS